MEPNVSIIILNWNGWKDTIECLESVFQIDYLNFNVIVVDNNSSDESLEKIRLYCNGKEFINSHFYDYESSNKPISFIETTDETINKKNFKDNKLILIKNSKNYGFAEGNNIGIRFTLNFLNPDYLLILNNDTIVKKNFLNELVFLAQNDNNIGVTGPKILFYEYNGLNNVINSAGCEFSFFKGQPSRIGVSEVDRGQFDEIKEVDYLEGACLLLKKDVIKKVGLFDASFFAYWDENDLCMRIQRAGFKCTYAPKSQIWHKGGSSFKKTSDLREYLMIRNQIWFMSRYASQIQYFLFLIYLFFFKFWVKLCMLSINYKNINYLKYFLRGFWDGFFTKP